MKNQVEKKPKRLFKKLVLVFFYMWALGLVGMNASLLQALDLQQYLVRHQHQNDAQFLEDFPYQKYQDQKINISLNVLEADRQLLNELGRPGDKFLYNYYQQIRLSPSENIQHLWKRFEQAEAVLRYAQTQPDAMVYEIIAQSLMENIAQELEDGIKAATFNKRGALEKKLIQHLQNQQFFINIPKSNWEKLQYHVSEGNWTYIADRVWKEYRQYLIAVLFGLMSFVLAYYFRGKLHQLMLKKS